MRTGLPGVLCKRRGLPNLSVPFSLILGGSLYQLLRRTHLSGDAPELVWRRVIVLALIAWLPLLVLSITEGRAWGGSVKVPFLFDVDVLQRISTQRYSIPLAVKAL